MDAEAFRRLADRAGLDVERGLVVVADQVGRTLDAWKVVRDEPGLPRFLRDVVDERLKMLPLARISR